MARYNGDVWRKSTFQGDGLVSNSILSIVEDGQGHLWFVGSKGATEHEPDRAAPQTIILSAPESLIPVSRVGFVFGAAYKESADLEFSTALDDTSFSCANEAQSSCWSPRVSFSREDIPDGRHTFSVRARDWAHDVDPTSAVFHFEVDATPPDAQLSSLSFGQPVRGTIDLVGMADDARFKNYRVEVRPSGLASWSGSAVTLLDSSEVRVGNGRVASWNTLGFAEGLYDVRLAVRDTLGLLGVSQTTVQVDNIAPFADVTSPRRIPAAGGDVYSRLGEVHVFFPPGALVAGDSVIIVPADTATMAGSRVTGAFSIAWQGELSKPATLEFVPGDSITTLSSGPIAIRRLADDGSWTLVGGTRDPANGHVSAPLRAPGTYALVRDVATTIAGPSLSNLSMSPRALSLSGGFGSAAGIAIGFTLAQPGRATLRVYNRAGHFVRELANGMTLNAGANLVRWDGRDRDGNRVREGLYLVSVEALGQVQTRTVAVVP